MKYKVKEGQDIFDISIQLQGSIDNVVDNLFDNNIPFNTNLENGTELTVKTELPPNIKVVNAFKQANLVIVNSDEDSIFTEIGDFNDDFNNDFDI